MRQLVALSDRWEDAENRKDFRSAQIAAMLYNVNRGKGKPALKPKDFMPRYKEPKQQTNMTDKDAAFNAMLKLAKSQGANIVER